MEQNPYASPKTDGKRVKSLHLPILLLFLATIVAATIAVFAWLAALMR